MKKLRKNFQNANKTVEAMVDSCLNGCSCSIVSCPCDWDGTNSYNQYTKFQTQHTNAFKNGAY